MSAARAVIRVDESSGVLMDIMDLMYDYYNRAYDGGTLLMALDLRGKQPRLLVGTWSLILETNLKVKNVEDNMQVLLLGYPSKISERWENTDIVVKESFHAEIGGKYRVPIHGIHNAHNLMYHLLEGFDPEFRPLASGVPFSLFTTREFVHAGSIGNGKGSIGGFFYVGRKVGRANREILAFMVPDPIPEMRLNGSFLGAIKRRIMVSGAAQLDLEYAAVKLGEWGGRDYRPEDDPVYILRTAAGPFRVYMEALPRQIEAKLSYPPYEIRDYLREVVYNPMNAIKVPRSELGMDSVVAAENAMDDAALVVHGEEVTFALSNGSRSVIIERSILTSHGIIPATGSPAGHPVTTDMVVSFGPQSLLPSFMEAVTTSGWPPSDVYLIWGGPFGGVKRAAGLMYNVRSSALLYASVRAKGDRR